MGLGLTIALAIINKHGGCIRVESTMGIRATFHIHLPVFETKSPESAQPGRKEQPKKGKVLFMDDELMMRNMVLKMLHRSGYQDVEIASDGAQAIELFIKAKDSGEPFAVVILDLTVRGGMGGKETIGELLKIDPSVTAIVATGYHDDPILSNFSEYGFKSALAKPFDMQTVQKTLQQVISGETQPANGPDNSAVRF